MELMDIKIRDRDRLITPTVNNGELIFVLKNLSRRNGQSPIVANKDGREFLKAQTSYRRAVKGSSKSINIITTGSMYLKILCLQKKTVQLLLPHQEKLARGPKFELGEWLLLKELPAKFGAVRTFVHNSCLKYHTLTRDWYLTMSIFVLDDNSITKRGNLYKHIPGEDDLYELLFLGGILNIFQTVFYDEWCDHRGYHGDTKLVSHVLFDWANADPSEIRSVEERAIEKTFEFAHCLEENESYKGCNFRDGFFPTGKKGKGDKGVGWREVCKQVAKKTAAAAAAAAITATEGPADDVGDLDEVCLGDKLSGVDELDLGEEFVCDCNGMVGLVSLFV